MISGKNFAVVLTIYVIFFPMHLCGDDASSSAPLFRYVESRVPIIHYRPTAEEVNELLLAYSSIDDFKRDLILAMQSECVIFQWEVTALLVGIAEHNYNEEEIYKYEKIKEIMLFHEIECELICINRINIDFLSDDTDDNILPSMTVRASHPEMVLCLISYYEMSSLSDIVFENTFHHDQSVRAMAYRCMVYMNRYDKKFNIKMALQCLRRGLEDDAPFSIGAPRVKCYAVATCLELGGWFHVLLWLHSPQHRDKLLDIYCGRSKVS